MNQNINKNNKNYNKIYNNCKSPLKKDQKIYKKYNNYQHHNYIKKLPKKIMSTL
jgi:hypothetical protein